MLFGIQAWSGLAAIAAALFLVANLAARAEPPPAPKPVERANPVYPRLALAEQREGQVTVYLDLDGQGRVANVVLADEDPAGFGFGESAMASARLYRFAPGTPGLFQLTIKFILQEVSPVVNLTALRFEQAVYPKAALAAGVSGIATAVISLSPTGKPVAVEVVSETPAGHGFGEAAAEALKKWTFNDAKVRGLYHVTFVFDPKAQGEGGPVRMLSAGACNVPPSWVQKAADPVPACEPAEERLLNNAGQVRVEVRPDGSAISYLVTASRPKGSGNGNQVMRWAQLYLKVCPTPNGGFYYHCVDY